MRRSMLPVILALSLTATGCGDDGRPPADGGPDGAVDAGPDDGDAGVDGGDPGDGGDEGLQCQDMQIGALEAPVEMFTDENGLVHLSCQTDADCMAALGYVHAARRFFVMDVNRRAARGRLATLFGIYGVDSDTTMRQYLTTRDGTPLPEAIWAKLRPDTRALYEAYAAGVNAWLSDLRAGRNGARPSEEYSYREATGVFPDDVLETIPDWDPLDSVALWVNVMYGNSDFLIEGLRNTPAALFPPDIYFDLFIHRPVLPSATLPGDGRRPAPAPSATPAPPGGAGPLPASLLAELQAQERQMRELSEWLGVPHGSNNWALSSAFTGGPAIQAGDPHGPLANPPYCMGYVIDAVTRGSGSLHVGGASFAGQPIFPLGYNADVAWGCTVSYADVTDVYRETVTPDGSGVMFDGQAVDFIERTESIEVAGDQPRQVTLRWVPHHGPVVAGDPADGVVATRRWTGHDAPVDLEAYLDLMRADSVQAGMDALAGAEATGCNAVLADKAGRVGWHVAVRIPARSWASAQLAPWLVLPGDGSAEWGAYLPLDQHPRLLEPAAGFVATANNAFDDAWDDGDPTNDGRPYWQSMLSPGYRRYRIGQRLEATRGAHSAADTHALQADTYSDQAAGIVPGLLAAAASDPDALSPAAADLVAALAGWHFTCPTGLASADPDGPKALDEDVSRESIGCTAYHYALVRATRAAFLDEYATYGDAAWFTVAGTSQALYRALAAPETMASGQALWDDLGTAGQVETRDQTLIAALNAAADHLTAVLGADPDDWRWGRVHTLTLKATIDLPEWAIGPFANDGAAISVDLGAMNYEQSGFAHVHGPVTRLVVALTAAGPEATYQVPGGLDLHRDSPYYDNLLGRWLENEPVPMAFARDQAVATGECTRLIP